MFNGFSKCRLGGNASRKRLRKARVGERLAEGGSDREVLRRLVDVLTTLRWSTRQMLRDLTSTVFKIPGPKLGKRGRSNGRGRSALPRLRWRNKNKPEAERADAQVATRSPFRLCVGSSVPAQPGLDEGVGSRTRGSSETVLGEQRVEERASAAGIARPVLQSEAVQESRVARKGGRASCSAWTRSPSHSRERWRQLCGCRKG